MDIYGVVKHIQDTGNHYTKKLIIIKMDYLPFVEQKISDDQYIRHFSKNIDSDEMT